MEKELVSLVILTYNFENIIMECLNSLEKQTYKNVEVIIADDCSKDNTLEICKEWKKNNLNRFKRIEIISSSENRGVTKNINIGARKAKGQWVKFLGGDDYLSENSLERFMDFKSKHENCEAVFSFIQEFIEGKNGKIFLKKLPLKEGEDFFYMSLKDQFQNILENCFPCAPGFFVKNTLLKRMNYFDERFKMVEDYPFWVKLIKNNIKLYFLPEVLVYYRLSENSVSQSLKGNSINKNMMEFEKEFYELIYKKEVKDKLKLWNKKIDLIRRELIFKNGNKSSFASKLVRCLKTENIKKYSFRIVILIIIYKIIFRFLLK